jgi:hypothetical protein
MPRALKRETILIWAAFLSIFFLTNSGFDTSEGTYHYLVAKQILSKGALGFDNPPPGVPLEGIFSIAPNGRTYSCHEIGNTLFLLPAAAFNLFVEKALGPRLSESRIRYLTGFIVSFVPSLYCAGTIALLYLMLRSVFTVGRKEAVAGVFAFGLCTYFWTYSRNLFDGVLCCTLLTAAVFGLLWFSRTLEIRAFVLSILFLGLAIITRLSLVLALFSASVYVVAHFRNQPARLVRLALIAALVLAPFAAWQLYYNHLRTGNPLTSPVQTEVAAANNGLDGNLLEGLAGLLFSPGKSIFVYCPLAALALLCAVPFWRKYRYEAIFLLAFIIPWFCLHAKLRSWYGAWGWGPRHFVTITPLLVLPFLVCGAGWLRARWARVLTVVACVWGFVLSACSIVGNWHFRLSLATIRGRGDDLIWSLTDNQALDMIRGLGENLRKILAGAPFDTVPGLSAANSQASNTVNVWLFTAHYEGVPIVLLIAAAATLLAIVVFSTTALLRFDPDAATDQRSVGPTRAIQPG